MGAALAIFKESGNTPVLKDRLKISTRCPAICSFRSFNFFVRIQLGSSDLLLSKEYMIFFTSALNTDVTLKDSVIRFQEILKRFLCKLYFVLDSNRSTENR